MPVVSDLSEIRTLLESDRNWAVYALGDLQPGFADHCTWLLNAHRTALALLYCGFGTPVLFTLGAPDHVRAIIEEVDLPSKLYLQVRHDILPVLQTEYRV